MSRIARCIGFGLWLVAGSAAAGGSAVEPVLRGEIPWVTSIGVRPQVEWADITVHGDVVVASPIGEADSPPLASGEYRAATLYMAMDGITLYPDCPTGNWPHSAYDCTHMVDVPTVLPAVSSATMKAQLFQTVQSRLAPFDIAVTTTRPPPYLPYYLAAIGGNGDWAGGICGQATLSCGGVRRNLISVNFPGNQNCFDIGDTVTHELGHNLGLEHTSHQADTMYTKATQPRSPQNTCSSIVLPDGKSAPSCGSEHAKECPAGNGNAQNTYAELMSRVGPRRHDVQPPKVTVWPLNGSVFTTEDRIEVTAHVEDEGGTVGVRWRWLQGLPPGYDTYEQCTNDVCELAFGPARASGQYDFVVLNQPPAGDYTFRLDAVDAFSNQVMALIHIRVDEPAPEPEPEEEEEGTTGEAVADDGDESGDAYAGDDDATTDEALPPGYGGVLGDEMGCGCRGSSPSPLGLLVLLPWIARRRRVRACAVQSGGRR